MVETPQGRLPVATIYDLLMGQFGVGRGLPGDYPASYDDELAYTPAWQERFSGVDRQSAIQFAREWATTAAKTEGQCMVIIGSGVNHWYHNDLIYRAAISTLMLTGCIGRNGGGLNHYVGQEKIAPISSWATIAFATDWLRPPRLQNTPSFHYVHSGQWRYERPYAEHMPAARGDTVSDWGVRLTEQHAMDTQVQAVRMGWLPFYPQFTRSTLEVVQQAHEAGARSEAEIRSWIVDQLKAKNVQFAVQDSDAAENWPRLWFIWRANASTPAPRGRNISSSITWGRTRT